MNCLDLPLRVRFKMAASFLYLWFLFQIHLATFPYPYPVVKLSMDLAPQPPQLQQPEKKIINCNTASCLLEAGSVYTNATLAITVTLS